MAHVFAVTRPVPSTILREQLWAGIKIKARDPRGFVPITECTVLSEDKSGLVRRIVLNGETIHEDVTFVEPYWAHFKMRENGNEVLNLISVGENNQTFLTFTFKFHFPGVEEGTDAWKEQGARVEKMGGDAVEKSIAKVEELIKEGKL